MIKQGAKLTATWEDVWEELPAAVKTELESQRGDQASDQSVQASSLFSSDEKLSPKERKLLAALRQDQASHIDEIIERVEAEMSSSEVFAVLFELELEGRIKQLPGKNFVKSF
jgi:DNA processing protein